MRKLLRALDVRVYTGEYIMQDATIEGTASIQYVCGGVTVYDVAPTVTPLCIPGVQFPAHLEVRVCGCPQCDRDHAFLLFYSPGLRHLDISLTGKAS
jgi:hypothetical protein